jgi:hypothetical protein
MLYEFNQKAKCLDIFLRLFYLFFLHKNTYLSILQINIYYFFYEIEEESSSFSRFQFNCDFINRLNFL